MRYFLILILSISTAVSGLCQEVLTELQVNPVVRSRVLEHGLTDLRSEGLDTIPVNMPFYDDFSDNAVFPSEDRWIDKFAFVNNDLAVYPVNIGTVTLDAISDSGTMYPNAVPGPANFIADHLTSRYIRLDSVFSPVPRALRPADSVYLSFFYQPQGRAKAPQKGDTLVLEFLVKPAHDSIIADDTIHIPDLWRHIWHATGMPLDTFYYYNNRWFAQVMVPVTDPVFFRKQFRFRFYNYVSLASSSQPDWQSNAAHWNLDNIYLNPGRSRFDTVYPEIRFVYPPPTLLKRYASMPYPQYCDDPTNELKDTLEVLMTNRDIIPHMSNYGYTVTNPSTGFSKIYSGGSYNVQPYTVSPYVTYQKFAHPEVPFMIPIGEADSAVFTMKHVITAPGTPLGDTITGYQRFYDYYAYDNGTPEASYGLSEKGLELAIRFSLNKSPDTLRAVRFYFNRTLSNNSMQYFFLTVWNDNAGEPGNKIYSELVFPKYADSINKFVTYHLNPPLPITATFYVGWIQTTKDNLSVGFDRYNNSQNEIFYKIGTTWTNTAFAGSVMVRPVVGKPIPLGTGDMTAVRQGITVFPNPCSTGRLNVRIVRQDGQIGEATDNTFRITDLTGHVRLTGLTDGGIDVSGLSPGLYFIEALDARGIRNGISKFIITR